MRATAELAVRLTELLMLAHPPVAVTFCKGTPSGGTQAVVMQPAGCCYWAPAQKERLETQPSDHANCSVGSYTHGLIDLEVAAAADDAAALLGSGWVGESDLANAPHLPFRPQMICYEPLAEANQADVVLVRLSVRSDDSAGGLPPDPAGDETPVSDRSACQRRRDGCQPGLRSKSRANQPSSRGDDLRVLRERTARDCQTPRAFSRGRLCGRRVRDH